MVILAQPQIMKGEPKFSRKFGRNEKGGKTR